MRRTREVIRGLADDTEPHYGVSTGFGALATRHIPVELRAQLQRSLVRSHAAGSGPEVEREVVRALMLLRISTLATGRTGIREETAHAPTSRCSTPASPRSCTSTARSAAPATSRRSSHCALALMGEGAVRDADGERDAGRRRAAPRPASSRSSWPRRRAWPSSTAPTACSACSCLAIADLRQLLAVADVAAAMSVEGLLGTDDVFAADLHALRPQPGQAVSAANIRTLHGGQRDPRVAPRPRRARGCRTPTRCAAPRRSPAAPATPSTTPPGSPAASWPRPSTTPSSPPDGRVESNGNFHGAPVAYVLDFLAIVAADVASIARAAHRPVPRRRPQPRPAAVPRRRPRRRLGPHDRAVHPGRDRLAR